MQRRATCLAVSAITRRHVSSDQPTVIWVKFRDDGYGDECPSSVEYDFIL